MTKIVKWLLPALVLTAVNAQVPAPKEIKLWPGTAPGSEAWKQPETTVGNPGNRRIMNVGTPTLTAYLPDPSAATGTAVIIAPGGGFVWLSIDSEGHDVAKWLAARGIAGIVLKYRLFEVEGQEPAQVLQAATAALGRVQSNRSLIDDYSRYGIADGIQAVKVVRAHAPEWGLSPERIVLTGFSAGAILTSAVVLQSDARPNFAAPIHGGPFNEVPPFHKGCRPSSLPLRRTMQGQGRSSHAFMTPSRPQVTDRNSTSSPLEVMVSACANKANPVTTGSTSSITGWRRTGSPARPNNL